MASFGDQLKKPSFWLSALAGLGSIGTALAGVTNPIIGTIGGIIVAVYTMAEHLATAVEAGQVTAAQVQSDVKSGNTIAAVGVATAALTSQMASVQQAVTDAAAVAADVKATAQAVHNAVNLAAAKKV